ncbi:hypothetical protein V5799_015088 [Amblyomma americanum]|uniref:Uncharacterized protein n=1 Tax=Amblyomma americanum TaxID=6943 RepID=A0AAQ4E159_AMBAM
MSQEKTKESPLKWDASMFFSSGTANSSAAAASEAVATPASGGSAPASSTAASSTAPASETPAAATSGAAASSSGGSSGAAIQLSDLQNILSGIKMPPSEVSGVEADKKQSVNGG